MLEDKGVREIITPEVVRQVAVIAVGFLMTISIAGFMMFTGWKVYSACFSDDTPLSEGEAIIAKRNQTESAPIGQRMKRD
jgi:hypothetical protein